MRGVSDVLDSFDGLAGGGEVGLAGVGVAVLEPELDLESERHWSGESSCSRRAVMSSDSPARASSSSAVVRSV